MKQRLMFSLVSIVIVGVVVWFFWPTKKTLAPTTTINTPTVVNLGTEGSMLRTSGASRMQIERMTCS